MIIGPQSIRKKVLLESSGAEAYGPNSLLTTWTSPDIPVIRSSETLLIVWTAVYNPTINTDITAVSRNSQAFTQLGTPQGGNNDFQLSLWYRRLPSTGNFPIVVTFDNALVASNVVCLSWAVLFNVHQTTTFGSIINSANAAIYPILGVVKATSGLTSYPLIGVTGRSLDGVTPTWQSNPLQTRLGTSTLSSGVGCALDTIAPNHTADINARIIGSNIGSSYGSMIMAISVQAAT